MMHPPTALPRSLAQNLNPPPVDAVVGDGQWPAERRTGGGSVARLVALLRRRPGDGGTIEQRAGSRPGESRALGD
jgi:hypothetical protein